MTNDIEKEYSNLSKKYKLPKFREIDNEFEISTLENPSFLTKNILRRIAEKLEFYIEVIGSLVHPDASSLSNMYEVRYFSDDEKNEIYRLFKKLMKINRSMIKAVLEGDEKKEADFLNNFFIEWLDIKKELLVYVEKMKKAWETQSTIEQDTPYFG
ncbi:MAG: hypothetical protein QGI38_03480 [Candidatus Woesearchaeota archaeon]|jgi:hypothetical protein|nr:hypothetical protein [Candidatus Woesearchaeota archaeon]|tara:strand:- start:88 stop:555 length:468 start_codon:yes stop_codon:yes gene_type:complete